MGLKRINLRRCAAVFLFVVAIWASPRAQGRDVLTSLIADVKAGPSVYYTPEAVSHYSRTGQNLGVHDKVSAEKSFESMIRLASMGVNSSRAIPVILDRLPLAVHVTTITGASYNGEGSYNDWLNTYVMNEKNKLLVKPPFLNYETINLCETFVEVTHSSDFRQKTDAPSGAVRSAIVDIHVVFTLHIGECALQQITGISSVRGPDGWRKWWGENSQFIAQNDPINAELASYDKGDFIPEGKYGLFLISKQTLEGTVKSVSDTAIVIETPESKRFLMRREQIFSSRLLTAPPGGTPVVAQPAVKKAQQAKAAPVAQPVSHETDAPAATSQSPKVRNLTFSELKQSPEIKSVWIRLTNGSILKGQLHSIKDNVLTLDVDGISIPVREAAIDRISSPMQ